MRYPLTVIFILLGVAAAPAQVVVYDPAVTLRNSVTAVLKEYLVAVQSEQHGKLRRMARRLSMHTDLAKYVVTDTPRWRTHDFENPDVFLFARAYHAALNYGDSAGAAFTGVSQPVLPSASLLARLSAAARRELSARLATIDVAAASAVTATHDTGQLRYNGRRELRAIEALERDVVDPSNEQSATAVLDKISGSALVAARQRQARTQLLSGIVEQLVVDGKRARDTEAGAMNMQLVAWRDRKAANEAFAAGAGDALQGWRQP